MIETTFRDCHNPLCGCGMCDDMESPNRDCENIICGCGCCEELEQ